MVRGRGVPGGEPQTFRMIRRIARPIVRLARQPGPNRLSPALMSSSRATGPLTIMSTAAPAVEVPGPWYAQRGSPMASTPATTTGKYSGRHPAMAALIAAFSAVTATFRWAMNAISRPASGPAPSRRARTRGAAGRLTGGPPAHAFSRQSALACPTSPAGERGGEGAGTDRGGGDALGRGRERGRGGRLADPARGRRIGGPRRPSHHRVD